MDRRFRLSLSVQILVAGLAGVVLGGQLSQLSFGPWSVIQQFGDLAATLFVTAGRALAIPLIVSSTVLGAVGLESMRSLGKVVGKSLLWMVGSTGLAVAIGAGAAYAVPLRARVIMDLTLPLGSGATLQSSWLAETIPPGPWGWTALVMVSLGFAYYRNQIDEGHARLITRFCQAIEEMLRPLVDSITRLAPLGVFALALALVKQGSFWRVNWDALLEHEVVALLLAWIVFGVVLLPLVLWLLARVNPWNYLRKLLPAMLTAFASGSVETALPITTRAVHQQAHVSNRVAGVVLSLGAALQREGMALGCAAVAVCHLRAQVAGPDWRLLAGTLLTCMLLGCGAGALRTGGGILFLVSQVGPDMGDILLGLGLGRFVMMGGAAVSVWSHACAAAVIAHGEGEFWVPGPPPEPDELQGLINQQRIAES